MGEGNYDGFLDCYLFFLNGILSFKSVLLNEC